MKVPALLPRKAEERRTMQKAGTLPAISTSLIDRDEIVPTLKYVYIKVDLLNFK